MSGNPPRRGRGAGSMRGRNDARGSSTGGRGNYSGGSQHGHDDSHGDRVYGYGNNRGGGSTRGHRGNASGGSMRGTPRPAGSDFANGAPVSNRPGIFRPDDQVAPEESVRAAEDRRIGSKAQLEMPRRPAYGTDGREITLRANYFRLWANDDPKHAKLILYRYDVEILNDPTKTQRRRLLQMILEHDKLLPLTSASDFSTIVVTTHPIDLGQTGVWADSFELVMDGNQRLPTAPTNDRARAVAINDARDRRTKSFKMTKSREYSLDELLTYLESDKVAAEYAAKGDIIQLLNIVIGHSATKGRTNVYKVGSDNKFYNDLSNDRSSNLSGAMQGMALGSSSGLEFLDLTGGLRALRGYYASVRPATNRLLLNLNVVSAAFYNPIRLSGLIGQFLDGRVYDRSTDAVRLGRFLRLVKVETDYLKERKPDGTLDRNKTVRKVHVIHSLYNVNDGGNGGAKQVSFRPTNGTRDITVFDHFKQEHDIELKQPNLPIVNVGNAKHPKYLPAEVCTVLPGQAVHALLNGKQTSEMIKFAARPPNVNAESITTAGLDMFRLTTGQQNTLLNKFGLSLDTNMITVPGRILSAPSVQYKNRKARLQSASWNLDRMQFSKPGGFPAWAVLIVNSTARPALNMNPQAPSFVPKSLFHTFVRQLSMYTVSIPDSWETQELCVDSATVSQRASGVKELKSAFGKMVADRARFAIVVLPTFDRWLYSRIKYYGDVEYGIHTVCCIGDKLQKYRGYPADEDRALAQYIGNLALKVNIKAGGRNHIVQDTSNVMMKELAHTMLVGIDVTHPSPGSSEGAPSIAGVVASYDEYLQQWPASLRRQQGRKEMVETPLYEMLKERLVTWTRMNKGALPKNIIVYRDGVSEGQYQAVLDQELPQFKKVFKDLYGGPLKWPKLAIIVVGKRHHTRFYPTKVEDAAPRTFNPQPGTVVDRGVTDAVLYDFYLQAHDGLQGTTRPAHYVVIYDGLKLKANALQNFTHTLCYSFNRATKAVSICPPAYYADLLCERARMYLYNTMNENNNVSDAAENAWTGQIHPNLRDSTFYI